MDAAAWLSGLLALAGVGIGGLLSAWAQGRAWKREQMRQWRDARRGAYGRLVAAVRQYRGYVAGPDAEVELWLRPDGSRLIAGIGAAGAAYQTARVSRPPARGASPAWRWRGRAAGTGPWCPARRASHGVRRF